MGVTSQVNGEQSAQTKELCETSKTISRNLWFSHLSHYHGHIYQQCVSNPILSYPIVALSMSDKQLNKVRKLYTPKLSHVRV